uniref:Uncharacterized protein n=1 Tax=Amphora coffeiformis TaxID=265554 RepID=A0A7S3P5U2_9STRA|mmetsp:Transcript_14654/g.27824  ORF Transcript_14654/g.27824 Transcript_14654/m.27824 type:complete len:172 (+) Transcript_14654:59-574(+)|eukprot:scaffold473_cov156-Amphora_coffeaeformis.AAC.8
MSDELKEPLTSSENAGEGGDDSSQRSSQSSLLERIRAQRAQQQQQTSAPASTIQIPQYNPVAPEENFAGGGPAQLAQQAAASSNSGSNFFSSAWNNINESMENGMASLQQEDAFESNQALLAPSAYNEENYSMMEYFMTFVRDVYGTFLNLPVLVRIAVIFALLFTAFKLM